MVVFWYHLSPLLLGTCYDIYFLYAFIVESSQVDSVYIKAN